MTKLRAVLGPVSPKPPSHRAEANKERREKEELRPRDPKLSSPPAVGAFFRDLYEMTNIFVPCSHNGSSIRYL